MSAPWRPWHAGGAWIIAFHTRVQGAQHLQLVLLLLVEPPPPLQQRRVLQVNLQACGSSAGVHAPVFSKATFAHACCGSSPVLRPALHCKLASSATRPHRCPHGCGTHGGKGWQGQRRDGPWRSGPHQRWWLSKFHQRRCWVWDWWCCCRQRGSW